MYLLNYLAQKPIVYFHSPPEFFEKAGKPSILATENHFKGKVYTLLDGGEGSTTGHLISLMKYHDISKFVGVESGATYICNDGSALFTLKNTRLRLKMARETFATEVVDMPKDRGIIPDFMVKPNPKDIAENRDTVEQYTLDLIAGENKTH